MKVMITLLFLAAAVVVHAEEEKESNMKFHPQAVLHYLEMEDENMAKQVRRIIKMDPIQPTKQSLFPTALPTGLPPKIVSIVASYSKWYVENTFLARTKSLFV